MSEKNFITPIKVIGDNLVTCVNVNCAHAICIPVVDIVTATYTWATPYSCTKCIQKHIFAYNVQRHHTKDYFVRDFGNTTAYIIKR